MASEETVSKIREVLAAQAKLPVDPATLEVTDDLFQAGLSSHASVNVMLALEDAFEVEFPDAMLTRPTFESIAAIGAGIEQLQAGSV